MDSVFESEEVNAYAHDMRPGWLYDKASLSYQPFLSDVQVKCSSPRYILDIRDRDFIERLISSPNQSAFDNRPWIDIYRRNNREGIVLLQGTKIIDKTGVNVYPDDVNYVVKSVHFKHHVDILILFDSPLTEWSKEDLKESLKSCTKDNVYPHPASVVNSWVAGYISAGEIQNKEMNSAAEGLREFIRYLVHSDVSCYPSTTTVLRPRSASVNRSGAEGSRHPDIGFIIPQSLADTQGHGDYENMDVDCDDYTHVEGKMRTLGTKAGDSTHHLSSRGDEGTASNNLNQEIVKNSVNYSAWTEHYTARTSAVSTAVATHMSGQGRTSVNSQPIPDTRKVRSREQTPNGGGKTKDTTKMLNSTNYDPSDKGHEPSSQQQFFDFTNGDTSLTRNQATSQQTETKTVNTDHHQAVRAENNDTKLSSTLIQPIQEDEICGMKRKYYGTKSDKKEKVIILLGASGSGKTTLVNFIANYFRGNKKADGELAHVARCCNDAQSLTKTITAYTFCANQDHTPITVIDTPGLNDSSGAEVRDHVLTLKTFLANISTQDYEIHALGFVAQAHLVRLTSSERLVMDFISTLFGEASGNHILTFVTFADSQDNPPIVEAMKNYGVRCKMFLKFNNSVLTIKSGDEVDELDRAYWRIGHKNWKKCMKALEDLPPLSAHTMKTLQNDVYISHVVDSAKDDLKSELKTFITCTKKPRGLMHEDAIKVCESVWQLATIANHHSQTKPPKTHIADTLVHCTQEVCTEMRTDEQKIVRLLSLAPTRELVRTGVGILQSMTPLYNLIVAQSRKNTGKTTSANKNISMYCHGCFADHALSRTESKQRWYGSTRNTKVTYECTKCDCDAELHGDRPSTHKAMGSTEGRDPVVGLTPHQLLHHTKTYVSRTVRELSIPGYEVRIDQYLYFLNYFTQNNHKNLIDEVLKSV